MRPFPEPVYVTRPLLPSLESLTERLRAVWESRQLTNMGVQHERLAHALSTYLDVRHLSLFNNGATALLIALRALGLKGSVVTTPFTFPATPHALVWAGIEPIFADIDPVTLTLDVKAAARAVRADTTGILPVHVYGLPCDVDGFEALAAAERLKLLFDGAHVFGTTIGGRGIGQFGDMTMFSFHATKLFHTAEGGALACRTQEWRAAVDHLKNFGIVNQEEVDVPGINGKLNEVQAALGLAVLELVPEEVTRRRAIAERYRRHFSGVDGITLMPQLPGVSESYQYFVIRIDQQEFGVSRDTVQTTLQAYNVMTRKYFFPLCSDYPCYQHLPSAHRDHLPVASRVVNEVLCLPMYGQLELEAIDRICEMVLSARPRSTPSRVTAT
jgi:dTDP-4-amino-4,6-dideoxygalactose transaminase